MTEQEFRARLADKLAAAEWTEQRKQQVLRQMQEPQKEARPMKKKLVLAICVVLVTMLSITAVATGGKVVNWQGETLTDLIVTSPGSAVNRASNFVDSLPDGQMAIYRAYDEKGSEWGGMGSMKFRPQTLEAARTMVEEARRFPWPVWLPEGYELVSATLSYKGKADARYSIASTETLDEEIELTYLTLPEEDRILHAYRLGFEDEQGNFLTIFLQLSLGGGGMFAVDDGEQAIPLALQGVNHALLIRKPESLRLGAEVDLSAPVAYSFPSLAAGRIHAATMQYKTILYTIDASGLTEAELLSIFGWQE